MDIGDFLHKHIGNPLEWSSAHKAILLLYIYLFEQVFYYLSVGFALNDPNLRSYLNAEQTAYHLEWFTLLPLVTIGLIVLVSIAKRKNQDSTLYEHLSAQHFALTHVYYGYTIGLMSLPTGVVLAGGPVVGFILFHRKAIAFAFLTAILTLAAFAYATIQGYIPYAPIAQNITPVDGQLDPLWSMLYCFFAAPHLLTLFGLAYYVLQRWRLREAEVQYLSSTDPLTGLMNRRSIMNHLSIEQEFSERTGQPLSVVMVDLDHFKQINDTWGHNAGDSVLTAAATALKNTIRDNDFVGRYGGEEFLVILPGLDERNAKLLAERIRQAVSKTTVKIDPDITFSVTASLGLSCQSTHHRLSSDELIRRADLALYKAKHMGRDQLFVAC